MGKFNCKRCCTTSECCDPDIEVAPEISIAGYTETGHFGNSCCRTYDFVPYGTPTSVHCCTTVSQHTIRYDCVHEDHAFTREQLPLWISPSPPPCPFPQEMCCLKDLLLMSFESYEEITQINKLAADITVSGLRVIFGKEIIRCENEIDGETFECKYFIKLILRGVYSASINSQNVVRLGRTTTYVHPCFFVDPAFPDFDDEGKSCTDEEVCISTPQLGHPCNNKAKHPCFTASGEWCIERIKYFDEKPTGVITLTEDDVLTDCDAPACGDGCGTEGQTICITSPINIDPPQWCVNPPTVETSTYTYVLDKRICDTIGWLPDLDLCAIVPRSCDPDTECLSPQSFTVICDQVVLPEDWVFDDNTCRFPSPLPSTVGLTDGNGSPVDGGAICGCYLAFNSPAWVRGVDAPVPCETNDCWFKIPCTDEFLGGCLNKFQILTSDIGDNPWGFDPAFWGKNDITITINCGSYTQGSCCFTPGPFALTLTYPE
jgi:hypothetical protein